MPDRRVADSSDSASVPRPAAGVVAGQATSALTSRRRSAARVGLAMGAVVAIGVVATGCSSHSSSEPVTSASASSATTHNAQDVEFASMMIEHHDQALVMSEMVPERTDNPQIIALAKAIENAQGPEIDQMQQWLVQWDATTPPATDGHGGHGSNSADTSASGGHGMMTDAQMRQLEESSGAAFDKMWLEMMIEHHEGAVEMSKQEVANGQNPQAIALAQTIINAQEAEIAQMKQMLNK